MNSDDFEAFQREHQKMMEEEAKARLARAEDLIRSFTIFAAEKGVVLGEEAFRYIQTIGIVASAPGLAQKILGALPTERDNLFCIDTLCAEHALIPAQPGYFVGEHYMLMAHPCFRRQMNEFLNFAPRFIDLFWEIESTELKKYLAIDENRVRIDVNGPRYKEADTWYGPRFKEEISKIPNGTTKLRPPLGFEGPSIDHLFANVYCLDIQWSQVNQIKTFQALEIKDETVFQTSDDHNFFPARYIHAEFDIDTNVFRHFDGAVHFFTEEDYFRRRDSDFQINEKHPSHLKAHSKKLFKFNGYLHVNTMVDFCGHFLARNPLVFEYFTGAYPEHVTAALDGMRRCGQSPGNGCYESDRQTP